MYVLMDIENLETGDLILVCNTEKGWFNYFLDVIKYSTHSDYVHIGMIVKDPSFLETPLKGTYVWESSYEGTPDPQDGKVKLGVQFTEINDFINHYSKESVNYTLFVRKLKDNSDYFFNNEILKKVHDVVYDSPYDLDIMDWIMAFFRKSVKPQKTSSFWCSALVGYIYTECKILNEKTNWSVLYPCDFAFDGENLDYLDKKINKLLPEQFELNI